jgi:hypothetical protein
MNRRPRRQYRLLGLLITIATLCTLASPKPRAGTITVFGPTKLTRTAGSPAVALRRIFAPPFCWRSEAR